jgi:hypothetical protein
MPSAKKPMIQIAKPIRTTANTVPTIPTITAHSSAHQKVRICHEKCESSQVPRTSLRLT